MSTVDEALTRLLIVRAAIEESEGGSELASVEAYTALQAFLEAAVGSDDKTTEVLAGCAILLFHAMPCFDERVFATAYNVLQANVDLLIERCEAA